MEFNENEETKAEQIQDLIDRAISNDHSEIEKINNLNEYFAAKSLAKGLFKLSRSFSTAARIAYKEYIDKLKVRFDDLQLLIDYRTLSLCNEFYYEEYLRVFSSIEEYRNYLSLNNLFRSIMGHDRRDDDDE